MSPGFKKNKKPKISAWTTEEVPISGFLKTI